MNSYSKLSDRNKQLNSLFLELLENLLEPSCSKIWLQKVANLLKQYLNAKYLALHTFMDNLVVYATDGMSLFKDLSAIKIDSLNTEPCWSENRYLVPLLNDAALEVIWDNLPGPDELKNYNKIFSLLASSLRNRDNLVNQIQNKTRQESLFKIENILCSDSDLKEQLNSLTREIVHTLNVSRVQVKIFSQESHFAFDNSLSFECVNGLFLDALSVIPLIEKEWLDQIYNGQELILDKRLISSSNKSPDDIEVLLSIKSIVAYPLFYKKKSIGVLVIHQCDYDREWESPEILYLKEAATMMSVVVGKELESIKRYNSVVTDPNTGLINSDEFLRELDHLQIEARISNSVFSLIMIDIEKLKDINLQMGFVAGNLVLSQTARYIKRLFASAYKIARYSNDEFIIILKDTDKNKARLETERLKDNLNNVSVLGVGLVDYNFSFVTFPIHASAISELLILLEQGMILSKSRGKSQVSSFDEICGQSKGRWQQLLQGAIPEIIIKKSNLKTGPEVFEHIQDQWHKEKRNYNADILDSVQSLALALDAKDSYTEGHSQRVSEYAVMLAKEIALDFQELEWIRLAAVMHDIGKIGIPESILCKPGKLTKEEYEVMKKHPVIGARILKPIKPLEKVSNLVLYHHEYWDGLGYPNQLSKTEIPVGSRIVSIVDAFQAMTSNRPYRNSLPFEVAISRLEDGRGKQWDPELVKLFIKIVK